MSEGDTIHRLARRIGEAMDGKPVHVSAPNPRGAATGIERLDCSILKRAEARGKHLLLWFQGNDGEIVLHSHLAMSGAWHLYRVGERWRKPRSAAWAVLAAGGWEAVQWGGPILRVLRPEALNRDRRIAGLGLDILAADFQTEQGVKALRAASSERELGDALLDQRLIAGIGNIYKSEGCFAARVSPWRRLSEIEDAELGKVVAATHDLMLAGVRSGRMPKKVYRRAGRPCPACRRPIVSRAQGDSARTTFWCSACQPG
jgi:endonuclease-8